MASISIFLFCPLTFFTFCCCRRELEDVAQRHFCCKNTARVQHFQRCLSVDVAVCRFGHADALEMVWSGARREAVGRSSAPLHSLPLAVPVVACGRETTPDRVAAKKSPSFLILRRHPLSRVRSDQLIKKKTKKKTYY